VHRELSTRSTLTSFLLRPEIMSLSKTLVLLGQVLCNNNREHRVGDGESLAWLAEKYGTTVNALKKLNNLKDDVIYSGRFVRHLSDVSIHRSVPFFKSIFGVSDWIFFYTGGSFFYLCLSFLA